MRNSIDLSKVLLQFVMAVAAGMLSAATLNVEFDVRTRAVESDPIYQRKNVAIFVLDRSGSMTWEAIGTGANAGQSRNDQLTASVRERIRTLSDTAPSTQVYLLPFNERICRVRGPFSLDSKLDKEKVLAWKGFDKSNCGGITLLYDTLAYALDFAEELIQADPKVKVQVYGYTDGDNFTAKHKTFINENGSFWGTPNVQYPTTKEGDAVEISKAYEKFFRKYGDKIKQYVMAGKMDDIQWRWLGAGDPPKGIENIRKDEYRMNLTSRAPVLKNPAAVAEQTLPVTLLIPLPGECAKDLPKLNATLTLDMNGLKVSGLIPLAIGTKTVSLQIPDKGGAELSRGRLSVADIPDAWKNILLKEPAPLEIRFSAPDKLSFLSFVPRGDVYVRVGDTVDFSAEASDGASVTWSIDGKDVGPSPVPRSFDGAGDHCATASAKKPGFVGVSDSVKVHVIDAGVAVHAVSSKLTVGEPVSFEAQARGTPKDFSWWIDEWPVSGQGKSLTGQVFERSGSHAVKVRASYGHGISAESTNVFEIATKPRLTIVKPDPGSEYEFGQKIGCVANVEGDFDKVVWTIAGPLTESREAPVVKEKRVANAYFTPAKGGQYTLSAKATDASGGMIEATTKIEFKVAREDLGVKIESPASGSTVELGPGVRNQELKAVVKGDAIRQIKWTMFNRKTGKKSDIRTTPVQDGVATCACPNDATIGDGVSLVIQAEAVMSGGGDPVISAPIELVTLLAAEIDVEAKVNGKVANGLDVRFGEQVDLLAVCKGCVDPGSVQWFAEANGKERAIGVGPKCSSPKEISAGKRLRTVRYFARAKLPDGSTKPSRRVTVHHICPHSNKPVIKLPRGADGITRTSFGLKDAVRVEMALPEGVELIDVVWDMGDGTGYKGMVVNHPGYSQYGDYTIAAKGKCKNCSTVCEASPVKIEVKKQRPKASFEIDEKGTYYTVGGKIHLRSTSKGDIENYIWIVDGKELAEYAGKPEAAVELPKSPCEVEVKLKVTGLKGADPSESEPKSLRIRYGWWAAVPAVLILVLLSVAAWRIFFGNGPKGWEFYTWEGAAPMQVNGGYPDELGDAYLNKGVPLEGIRKWNYWTKKGRLRLGDMLLLDEAPDNVWAPFSEDEFEVKSDNGTPIIRPPDGKFDDVTGEVNLTGEAPYFLFRYYGSDYMDEIANGHDHIRVRVVNNGEGFKGAILFLLSFGLLIWAFVAFCRQYAI